MKKLMVLGLLALAACGDDDENNDAADTCPYSRALPTQADYCSGEPANVALSGPCTIEVANPRRLLVTTTDFTTGAVSVVDAQTSTVQPDVRSATSDSIPFFAGGHAQILSRFNFNRLDVLDPSSLALQSQTSLTDTCSSNVNPQSIAVRSDGIAFIPTLGDTAIQIIDTTKPAGETLVGRVPMQQYADADGIPELGFSITCGDVTFVTAQRLANFAPTGSELLVPVDMNACTSAESQAMELLGNTAKQARNDGRDASGHTAFVLTTGIERVNLAERTVAWQVPASAFEALGIFGFQLQSFDVHGADTAYVAAAKSDFSSVDILRVALDGSSIEVVISGVNAVEKTLEIIGDTLWFGDTTFGSEGMRAYDLTQDPPEQIAGPLSTGLPPYSVVAIP